MSLDSLTILAMRAEIAHSIQDRCHVYRDDARDAFSARLWGKVARSRALLREAAEEAAAFERDCLAQVKRMERASFPTHTEDRNDQ